MFFYTLVDHIIDVLKKRVVMFFVVLGLFLGLFAFFFGLYTIPLPEGVLGFYRMETPTPFEYFYFVFSSVVSALIVVMTFHRIRLKLPARMNRSDEPDSKTENISSNISDGNTRPNNHSVGQAASLLGVATGMFGAVCPACLGINFLLFGNVFTAQLSFLIPYIFWIQLSGIALLLLGLYLVAKSSYEKKCILCSVEVKESGSSDTPASPKFFINILAGTVVLLLVFQIAGVVTGGVLTDTNKKDNTLIANDKLVDVDEIVELVTPVDGFNTDVRWGDVVSRMISTGVLDPQKLEDILIKRYGQEMKPEWSAILAGEDATLEISNDNAVFMMYLLWVLAKHNDNQILHDSQFSKYFSNYDIGVGRAGYGDILLLPLTLAQQQIAKEVAENAYRPCCGNSTAAPDCSHGFSALGLIQLMASQNFSKTEIFDVFVKFNSFWFPETYVKNALYFQIKEDKNWSDVDKELIAGIKYSSLRGSYKVKNYLKENFGI